MAISSELISQLVKVTNDKESGTKETVVYGTIVDDGIRKYVQLDGSDISTPVVTTTEISADDRVIVQVKNHTATVTGNVTDPAIGTKRAEGIESSITQTAKQIELRITDEVSGLESKITQTDSSIRTEITNQVSRLATRIDQTDESIASLATAQDGLESKITQNSNSITTLVSNQTEFSQFQQTVSGFLFEDESGVVKIDGGNVYLTGMIAWADMTDDLRVDVEQVGKDASNASTYASNASSSASQAASSASSASTYASHALNHSSAAASSASAAATSANNAASSASDASTYASNASSYASSALANANSTADAYAATQAIADSISSDLPSYLTNTTITDVSLMSPVIIGGRFYAVSEDSWLEMESDGLYMYTDGIYTPKLSIINDDTSIKMILGAGEYYGNYNRLYLQKFSTFAQLYYEDGDGNICGLQFNSGGTVTLIGSWA